MTTFFTSDLHLGHLKANELCSRPYGSVEEMNYDLIARHNSVVQPDDMVYYLGDMCMGKLEDSLPMLNRLNGNRMLILGNHDRPSIAYHHKTPEARAKWNERYCEYFSVMFERFELPILQGGDESILLSHFPYNDPDFKDHEYEGRYASLLPENQGQWLIHGHVHGSWRVKGRQINVGVDAWNGYPVSLETILDIVENPDQYNAEGPYRIT
jgi:calcineurin-like phosphoesterase family protein